MTPEPSISFLNAFVLFGGVQGLAFAFILLVLRRDNKQADRYLAILMAVFGVLLLHQFALESGYIYKVPYLLGSVSLLEVTIAPVLYLYVHTMTVADSRKLNWFWITVPACMIGVLIIPFQLADFDTKLSLINNNYIFSELPTMLGVSFVAAMIISGGMFTVYLVLSFKLLFSHTRNIAHFFSYRENIELAWLRNLLLAMLLFWVLMIIFYLLIPFFRVKVGINTVEYVKLAYVILDVLTVVTIFYMGVMGLLQARVYTPDDLVSSRSMGLDDDETTVDSVNTVTTKYKNSALSQNQSVRILQRLTNVMERDRAYLRCELTLVDLAGLAETTPNYLSQVINEQLNMNFFDYVNAYRIETAKALLLNTEHKQTVLDVAMASAFNSKSAFYTAFKKHMHMTPVQFKKSLS